MKILAVSEYPQRGSGYGTILDGLLGEWDRRGDEVVALAFDYNGFEHPHRAAVVPTDMKRFRTQVGLVAAGFRPDALVVCYDLSVHHGLRQLQQLGVPYIGIFPIESDPLLPNSEWMMTVDTMDAALCESRFGTQLLQDAGLRATYFPVGIDTFWRPPSAEERADARHRWNLEERFAVYTVADNQERKHIPAHFAAMALLLGKEIEWPPLSGEYGQAPITVKNAYYVLNTKKRAQKLGYNLFGLSERFGITADCLILEHEASGGLDRESLREIYWASDAYLQLSKAEGLGLPVLEAMCCGLPVVGTDCTGIAESLGDGRGCLVPAEYVDICPFDNQYRRWADPFEAAEALGRIASGEVELSNPTEYACAFTWERAGDVLEGAIRNAIESRAQAASVGTSSNLAPVG